MVNANNVLVGLALTVGVPLTGFAVPQCLAAESRAWPRCRLEAVSLVDGKLTALAAMVDREGANVRMVPRYQLLINGSRQVCQEPACHTAQQVLEDCVQHKTQMLLLIESSLAYRASRQSIGGALRELLRELPSTTLVRIGSFGAQLDLDATWHSPQQAVAQLDGYSPGDEGELLFVDAMQRASNAFAPDAPDSAPTRRVIVVVGSGYSSGAGPQDFVALGDELQRRGVVLYPIGFAQTGYHPPLRNLAELAKRTAGTFRWARAKGGLPAERDLGEQARTLSAELRQVQVITFAGAGLVRSLRAAGQKGEVRIAMDCGDQISNEKQLALDADRAARQKRRHRLLSWLLATSALLLVVALSCCRRWLRKKGTP